MYKKYDTYIKTGNSEPFKVQRQIKSRLIHVILGIGIRGVPDWWFISANAFVFALFAALMLDAVIRWTRVESSGVVLFGIALVSMLQFIAREDTLRGWCSGRWVAWREPPGTRLAYCCWAFSIIMPISMLSSWELDRAAFRRRSCR